jgi:hypothetical protein
VSVCEGVGCGQNEDEWCREKCPTKQCSNNRINGKKVCDCDEDHKLNPETGLCELKKFGCGEEEKKHCNKRHATCRYDSSSDTKFSCECFDGLVPKYSNKSCEIAVYAVTVEMYFKYSESKKEKNYFYSRTPHIKEENYINFNSIFSSLYSEQNELNKKLEIEAKKTSIINKTLIIDKILNELKKSLLDKTFIGISKVNKSFCEPLDNNNFENFRCDLALQLSKEINTENVKKMINNKLICKVNYCSIGTQIRLNSNFSVNEIKVKYFLLFINLCYINPELCSF